MAGSQHFYPGDIQFQLVYDRGQCAELSYLETGFLVMAQNTHILEASTGTIDFFWLQVFNYFCDDRNPHFVYKLWIQGNDVF